MKINLVPMLAAIFVLVAPGLTVGGGTNDVLCDNFDLSALPDDLPNLEELKSVLTRMIESHCLCEFPQAVRDHLTVTWDPRFDSVDEVFSGQPECFGRLSVGMVKVFGESLIGHVILDPVSPEVAVDYVTVEFSFQFSEGKWVCSWPKGIEHTVPDCP
jgi:hypothetical protein